MRFLIGKMRAFRPYRAWAVWYRCGFCQEDEEREKSVLSVEMNFRNIMVFFRRWFSCRPAISQRSLPILTLFLFFCLYSFSFSFFIFSISGCLRVSFLINLRRFVSTPPMHYRCRNWRRWGLPPLSLQHLAWNIAPSRANS